MVHAMSTKQSMTESRDPLYDRKAHTFSICSSGVYGRQRTGETPPFGPQSRPKRLAQDLTELTSHRQSELIIRATLTGVEMFCYYVLEVLYANCKFMILKLTYLVGGVIF